MSQSNTQIFNSASHIFKVDSTIPYQVYIKGYAAQTADEQVHIQKDVKQTHGIINWSFPYVKAQANQVVNKIKFI